MDEVRALREANDGLAGSDLDALGDAELGGVLVDLHREQSRLVATRARVMRTFEASQGHRVDGSKSPAGWLARATHCAPGDARALGRLARRLPRMPFTRVALGLGRISPRHAQVLGGLCVSRRKPVADAFPEAEEMLVGYAVDLLFDEFLAAVRYWENVVDADGAEDQAASDHAARYVHLSQIWRGNWALDGQLDALGGEQVHIELMRIDRQLFDTDWNAAKAIHGDNTCLELLDRTPAQRRCDALAEMARRSAAMPADATEPRPLLVIHLGHDSLRRMSELATGTVITPGMVVPLLGDADIQRIIYDPKSKRIHDLSERARFFTGPLREAIILRDRRCQTPGCRVPAHDCEVDHLRPNSKGGLTTDTNGQPMCGSENRHKSDTIPDNHPDRAPPEAA